MAICRPANDLPVRELEVRYSDGRASRFFYWDDLPSRRLRPETLDRETALEKAEALARGERIAR